MDEASNFEVIPAFERSLKVVRQRLRDAPLTAGATVSIGDARTLTEVGDYTVDAVLTSPPYLNALDYIRGHRLSLVWLGYSVRELRGVRSNSIDRAGARSRYVATSCEITEAFGDINQLLIVTGMIDRYASDVFAMMKEITRVLR